MEISACAKFQVNYFFPASSHSSVRRHKCEYKYKYAGQSVRALPIRILTVGKKRSPALKLLADEYINKLKQYCSVHDIQIRSNPKNARDVRAQVDDEDRAVANLISSNDWVVMLDEKGVDIGSEQMAELVGNAANTVWTDSPFQEELQGYLFALVAHMVMDNYCENALMYPSDYRHWY